MRRTSRVIATAAVVSFTVLLAACDGSGKSSRERTTGTADDTASANNTALPAECSLPPFTAHVGTNATGTLTIQGIFSAPLAQRTLPLG